MGGAGTVLKPNTLYTIVAEISPIGTARQIGTGIEFTGDTNRYQVYTTETSLRKQRLVRTWTSPATMGGVRYIWFFVSGTMNIGDQFAVHRVMLVEGNYTGPHSDGDTPGWRWDGAPHASPSVGYPYTLENIVGAPMLDLEGDNVQGLLSGDPLSDFTVYSVYDVLDTSINYNTVWKLAHSPLGSLPDWNYGGMAFGRRGTGAGTAAHIRLGTSAGNNQNGIQATGDGNTLAVNAFTPGRRIAAVTMYEGLTRIRTVIEYSPEYGSQSTATLPGAGIPRIYLRARGATNDTDATSSTSMKAVRTLYYPKNHSLGTRRSIIRWLSNRYGVAGPTSSLGYNIIAGVAQQVEIVPEGWKITIINPGVSIIFMQAIPWAVVEGNKLQLHDFIISSEGTWDQLSIRLGNWTLASTAISPIGAGQWAITSAMVPGQSVFPSIRANNLPIGSTITIRRCTIELLP